MLKFFQKIPRSVDDASTSIESSPNISVSTPTSNQAIPIIDEILPISNQVSPNMNENDIQLLSKYAKLPSDPARRIPILNYPHKEIENVRRTYLLRGPNRPLLKEFPLKQMGKKKRRFNKTWFLKYPYWLEYSESTNAAYCLCCYLFGADKADDFGRNGFKNWKKSEKLGEHEGKPNSVHNQARSKCQDLMNQAQHMDTLLYNLKDEEKLVYRIRLTSSIKCIRYLLKQGLAFRGHDESEDSSNKGNFLELLELLADSDEEVKNVVLKNAPKNLKLTSPDVQKDIVNAIAQETLNLIMLDIGDALFSILVDEARDVSIKEQMAVVIRYVNKKGMVVERFIGIQHVSSTKASCLKVAIEEVFNLHGLSISRLRGQGYDGASNMQGEFNGLKALILNENPSAYYVHCFSHQLQLALVGLAKHHDDVDEFFLVVKRVINSVGSSCKRKDVLLEKQAEKVIEALSCGELSSGRGLNQETNLKRPGDTRWGTHYHSLLSLVNMFSAVVEVLEVIGIDGDDGNQRTEANKLVFTLLHFEFIFFLHLMLKVLGTTSELSQALQRKDQDIVNAMNLVQVAKINLQETRENGWEALLKDVYSFCGKCGINVLSMEDDYVALGRNRRGAPKISNLHHYKVEVFNTVLDTQFQELDRRFSVSTTELLLCAACLCPSKSFARFDKSKLMRMSELYPLDFPPVDLLALGYQLDTYITDMRNSSVMSKLKGISDLAQKMVEMETDRVYPLVFKLVTLALILPVATATVERSFSAMNIVKNRLRNRMGDVWMNDNLVAYIERDIFIGIDNEVIIQRFQKMKPRKVYLS